MTPGQQLFLETTGRDYDWPLLKPNTRLSWEHRAAGDLSFIPSVVKAAEEPEEAIPEIPVPAPVLPARFAKASEFPGGAKTVFNRALKNGWFVQGFIARGPWFDGNGVLMSQNAWMGDRFMSLDASVLPVLASTFLLRGARAGRLWAAQWLSRPDLKESGWKLQFIRLPGGEETKSAALKALIESRI